MSSQRHPLLLLAVLLFVGGIAGAEPSAAAPAPTPATAATSPATCTYYSGTGIVEPGKPYPDRRTIEVQCLINTNTSYRPKLSIDGIYGPHTVYAVTVIQQEAGLTPNGIVDPATWAALRAGVWW
ncbi:peptidoglycan-binding domain-containing protein [Streptomyces sp. NPDC001851]|uniref:peptidoglycan-binding domain-containing protein n=1 Tax=Streptomyces sp. NPDC001851 TaxID=3154529 RepID=UPI00331AC56D